MIRVAMARLWVLDTETKGTGAQMVPLEKMLKEPAPEGEPSIADKILWAQPAKAPRPSKPPEVREPARFKVVDVMTERVLAEGARAAATVAALKEIRSVVDVSIYVWEPKAERWQPLTLGERKMMWRLRDRLSKTAPPRRRLQATVAQPAFIEATRPSETPSSSSIASTGPGRAKR